MPLPTSKQPLPGFRLIADDAGSYIDDVNNIRLSNKFTLTKNTADPSASVDIDPATIVPNSGSALGRFLVPVLIDSQTKTASTSYTSPSWAADLYSELQLKVIISSGSPQATLTLTGLSGGAYSSKAMAANGTVSAFATAAAWVIYPSSPGGFFNAKIGCKNGVYRTLEALYFGGGYGGNVIGNHSDTTHDVTGISMSLDQSSDYTVTLTGIPK